MGKSMGTNHFLKNGYHHLKTINHHKKLVMINCFKVGLYKQGLLHDLSKYSISEFKTGIKYFDGQKSPNGVERETIGYSFAWLHHKGRNKHHYEFWTDLSAHKEDGLIGIKMPLPYVVEMVMDRIAACKTYEKENYTDRSPLNYYLRGRKYMLIHEETDRLLKWLLTMLAIKGEKRTLGYIKHKLLPQKNY